MESISFCRRKFDAIPFCREMQRRYLAVPKINPKSSDAECSAAPKKRFCGNAKPLLFLSFPEISGRDSNSPSGRPASRPLRTVLRTVRKGAGESLPAHQRRGFVETQNLFFFVAFGSLWKGLEQPVRPPCVPALADSPADCPQGRGRVPSSAPKKRFCGNAKPLLFLLLSGASGRDSNSPSGRFSSPAHKKQRACAFRKPSSLLPFRHRAPFGDCPRQKNAPGPPELGAGRAGGFAVFH